MDAELLAQKGHSLRMAQTAQHSAVQKHPRKENSLISYACKRSVMNGTSCEPHM